MVKKAQFSSFVIVGIVIVIVVAGFFVSTSFRNRSELTQSSDSVFSAGTSQNSLDTFIHECIKQNVIEAELEHGLHNVWSPPLIEEYVLDNLPDCLDSFKFFKNQGFKVSTEKLNVNADVTREALIVNIIYPVSLQKNNVLLSFDEHEYTFPRTVIEKLKTDEVQWFLKYNQAQMLLLMDRKLIKLV